MDEAIRDYIEAAKVVQQELGTRDVIEAAYDHHQEAEYEREDQEGDALRELRCQQTVLEIEGIVQRIEQRKRENTMDKHLLDNIIAEASESLGMSPDELTARVKRRRIQ